MQTTERQKTLEAERDARNENILIYVDGALLPCQEAKISVYDSGFLLGGGVWEGLRLHAGKWAFLSDHLDRLFEAALATAAVNASTRFAPPEGRAAPV